MHYLLVLRWFFIVCVCMCAFVCVCAFTYVNRTPCIPQVGSVVQLVTGMRARVTNVTDETVTIDANHELAGKTLLFDVELVNLTKVCGCNVGGWVCIVGGWGCIVGGWGCMALVWPLAVYLPCIRTFI